MAMVRDVVCGMDIESSTAAATSEYKGNTYFFCSNGCKRDFDQEPEHYLEPYRNQNLGDVALFVPVAAVAPGTVSGQAMPIAPVVAVGPNDANIRSEDDVRINEPTPGS